jgi:hypothetical protein
MTQHILQMPIHLLSGGEPPKVLVGRAGMNGFARLRYCVSDLPAPALQPLLPLRNLVPACLTNLQMKQGVLIFEAALRRLDQTLRRQVPAVIHAAPHCVERNSSGIPFSGCRLCHKSVADAIANRPGYAKYGGLNPLDFHAHGRNFRNIAGGEALPVIKPENRTVAGTLRLQTAINAFDQESAIDGCESVFRGRQAEAWVLNISIFPARTVLLSSSGTQKIQCNRRGDGAKPCGEHGGAVAPNVAKRGSITFVEFGESFLNQVVYPVAINAFPA